MIEVGDRVRTVDGQFEGRVLGKHGRLGAGGAGEYWSLPDDMNLTIYALINDAGEVRYFSAAAIEGAGE